MQPAKLGIVWWEVLRQVSVLGLVSFFQSICNFLGEVSSKCKLLWMVLQMMTSSSRRHRTSTSTDLVVSSK